MSQSHRTRGVKVLKAVSSPLRLQFLNLLFDRNALSYTELMTALKMNPSRDAGRFAYHLKFLLKTSLVEADVETKKYFLTDLGKMIIDVADRVEKNAQKTKTMLVRTSHSTLEEFDSSKITNALIKEAKMPPDQAQRTAKETEKLLEKSKTKYLTAPLIREIVNTILIQKGQEHYRHKLTRLGLPVHEVTSLIEGKDTSQGADSILRRAGQTIFEEYTVLNVLPRDIADAHASGAIHINNLSTWLLKPNEVVHDVRFFLQNGLKTTNMLILCERPPETFESALSLLFSLMLHSTSEIDDLQTLDHFNLFLAPFMRDLALSAAKEHLRLFLLRINQHVEAAINLTLSLPSIIAEKSAIGPQGKTVGKYADFAEESLLLASLILEIIREESIAKMLLNPRIILKINKETLSNDKAKAIALMAHELAAERGVVYFSNAYSDVKKPVSFSSTGSRFEPDLTGDWETDTLRTGRLGMVTVNLPRIAQESEKDSTKFFDLLRERYELAARALEIKSRMLRQREKVVLPFMTQNANGDKYFRLENCSSLVNFAGLQETIDAFGKRESATGSGFKWELLQNIVNLKMKGGKRRGKRLFPVILQSREASERLAQLDVDKYGVAKVKFSGVREKPFYSTVKRLRLQAGNPLGISAESLEEIQRLKVLNPGGNLSVIELGQTDYRSEDLLNLTLLLFENQIAEFIAYNRAITYCCNCDKSWFGVLHKCPVCGAISTLTVFDRFSFS